MKCDKLKARTARSIADEEEMLELGACDPIEQELVYNKDEVDYAIAELKAQLRKTQRALWHDRAIRAEHMKNLIFEGELIYHDDNDEELDWRIMYRKWERAEAACRAKAKEYE